MGDPFSVIARKTDEHSAFEIQICPQGTSNISGSWALSVTTLGTSYKASLNVFAVLKCTEILGYYYDSYRQITKQPSPLAMFLLKGLQNENQTIPISSDFFNLSENCAKLTFSICDVNTGQPIKNANFFLHVILKQVA